MVKDVFPFFAIAWPLALLFDKPDTCNPNDVIVKTITRHYHLQRLLKLRLPFETALNKSPGLCPCILIELACRVMVTSFSRENLFTSLGLQVSGLSNNNPNGQAIAKKGKAALTINDYRRLLAMCKSTLGLSWNVPNTIQMLAMHFLERCLWVKSEYFLVCYVAILIHNTLCMFRLN